MSYIKKEKIEQIKEKADIVSVVSDHVSIKRSGKYYIGNCPFHSEKTPSFFLYPQTNTFHCFGCGKHGDSISFLMDIESLDYISAIKVLAEKFNIQLEYEYKNGDFRKVNLDKYYEFNSFVSKFYYKKMMENSIPKKYLLNRGISQKSINLFMLGYADNNWKSLYNELKFKNLDINIALELGLIIKTKNNDFIDRFRNRIIFPIFNKNKKIIGFGGRTIVNDKAKYLNSPESVIFKKGDNLYAIDKVLENNIRDKILIVEGYMDVISLYQNGVNYVVAGLGTAFTENQARLARRFSKDNIYLCYDGDNAGINATKKTASVFNKISISPNILTLPYGLDPDDYIKKFGLIEFNKLLKNSEDIYEFNYINLKKMKKDTVSVTDNAIFYEKILKFLFSITTSVLRDLYINKVCNEFGIEVESLKEDLSKFNKSQINNETNDKEDLKKEVKIENNLLTNNDKKLLVLGIILTMRCIDGMVMYFDKINILMKDCELLDVFNYVYSNFQDNTITTPAMLISKFKNNINNIKLVEYVIKCYKQNINISSTDYSILLDNAIINFEIRKVTLNIEKLKTMDLSDENVVKNLNLNIKRLMSLHKNLKNM